MLAYQLACPTTSLGVIIKYTHRARLSPTGSTIGHANVEGQRSEFKLSFCLLESFKLTSFVQVFSTVRDAME